MKTLGHVVFKGTIHSHSAPLERLRLIDQVLYKLLAFKARLTSKTAQKLLTE